jgi:hypothetical protein
MLPSSSPEAVASFLTQCTTPTSTRWVRAGLACMFWIENQRYFPENTADFQRYYFWNDGRVLGREHSMRTFHENFQGRGKPQYISMKRDEEEKDWKGDEMDVGAQCIAPAWGADQSHGRNALRPYVLPHCA